MAAQESKSKPHHVKRIRPDVPEAPHRSPTERERWSLALWEILHAVPAARAEGFCVLLGDEHQGLTLELEYNVQSCQLEVRVPQILAPRVFHALHKWGLVGGVYSVRKPSMQDVAGTVRIAMEDKATTAEVVSAIRRARKAFAADKDEDEANDDDAGGITKRDSDAVLALLSAVEGAIVRSGRVRVCHRDGSGSRVEAVFDVLEGWFRVECHHTCIADNDFMGRLFHAVHESFREAGRYSVTASRACPASARIIVEGVRVVRHAVLAMRHVRKVFAVHTNGSCGDKDDSDDEDGDEEDSDEENSDDTHKEDSDEEDSD